MIIPDYPHELVQPPAIVAPAPRASNPAQGFYVGVPTRFAAFVDARGCVVIRVPELAEGLYCDA